ncbi:MAG: 2-C-methyl-D-erythritol 2,4-cyclodiphosphate synthase, partial [Chloroflexi bacterium]|nr:2-C-methyl-D-erythritol 2,4-cyclodiphosphate synthase [Chloroflexota bacterium]
MDAHQLAFERTLMLGGVVIPHERGLEGHSDGDAVLHAVIDALLGAAALGDIGQHFPSSDQRLAGISSVRLVEETAQILARGGWRPVNVDITIIAQEPRLSPYVPEMRLKIAAALG